ncbi:MAG: type II secretion system protein [Pseudomonadota bacterium]
MQRNKKQVGFSLIETMFALAVIAVIMLGGVSLYQQHLKTMRVQKTALQMQLILQAAQAYYTQNTSWPVSLNDLVDANYLSDRFRETASETSPFGTKYTIVQPDENRNNPNGLFTLALETNPSVHGNEGQLVANRLPMAQYLPSGVVQTSVNHIPIAGGGEQGDTIIKRIVTLTHNESKVIDKPNCPSDYSAKLYTSLNQLKPAQFNGNSSMIREVRVSTVDVPGEDQWRTELVVDSQAGLGEGDVVAIAYCERNPAVTAINKSEELRF